MQSHGSHQADIGNGDMDSTRAQFHIHPRAGGTHAILVAARDAAMRLLLSYTLNEDLHRIQEEETEDAVLLQAQISRPALLVIDSDLVQGSGIEACRRIRADRLTRGCAVVLVSARADQTERNRALAAGADAFVTKPFSPAALLGIAAAVCERSVRARPSAAEVGRRTMQRLR